MGFFQARVPEWGAIAFSDYSIAKHRNRNIAITEIDIKIIR